MISQIVTSSLKTQTNKEKHGGRRKPVSVFTEHGVLMLANVLRSKQAIAVSIQIIEAFVRLRQVSLSYADIAAKIGEIESRYTAPLEVRATIMAISCIEMRRWHYVGR